MLVVFTVKPGDVVNIYEDPWTETKVEGKAKLIERLQKQDEREYWLVEFVDGHKRHTRWIKAHSGNLDGARRFEIVRKVHDEKLVRIGLREGVTRKEANLRAQYLDSLLSTQERAQGVRHVVKELSPQEVEQLEKEGTRKGNPDGELKAPTPREVYERLFPKGQPSEPICTRLQGFIDDEDGAIEDYRGLMRELRQSERPDLAIVAWRIAEDEERHREDLKKVKEALCPAA